MNAFAIAVNNANAAAITYSNTTTKLVYTAAHENVDKDTILAAVSGVNRMLSNTRRALDVFQRMMETRNTAKLSFEAWWDIFVMANPPIDTGCATFNKALEELDVQINNGTQADKIQYYWDEVMPAIYVTEDVTEQLKWFLQELVVAKQVIDNKRKAVM